MQAGWAVAAAALVGVHTAQLTARVSLRVAASRSLGFHCAFGPSNRSYAYSRFSYRYSRFSYLYSRYSYPYSNGSHQGLTRLAANQALLRRLRGVAAARDQRLVRRARHQVLGAGRRRMDRAARGDFHRIGPLQQCNPSCCGTPLAAATVQPVVLRRTSGRCNSATRRVAAHLLATQHSVRVGAAEWSELPVVLSTARPRACACLHARGHACASAERACMRVRMRAHVCVHAHVRVLVEAPGQRCRRSATPRITVQRSATRCDATNRRKRVPSGCRVRSCAARS